MRNCVYHDATVHLADDASLKQNVPTLYNDDANHAKRLYAASSSGQINL